MLYSGGQLIAEYDLSTGALKKEYVYGAKGLIATVEPSTGTRYTGHKTGVRPAICDSMFLPVTLGSTATA